MGNDILDFVGLNILVFAGLLLLIFIYLVLLIRKRWKQGFLHVSEIEKEKKKQQQAENQRGQK